MPFRAKLTAAVASAFLLSGCLPAIIAGEVINGERRSDRAADDRLRPLTALALGIQAADVAVLGNKDWRDGVLHWTAATTDGRRYACQATGEDTTARCTPAT
jgi:hypothetical protein